MTSLFLMNLIECLMTVCGQKQIQPIFLVTTLCLTRAPSRVGPRPGADWEQTPPPRLH